MKSLFLTSVLLLGTTTMAMADVKIDVPEISFQVVDDLGKPVPNVSVEYSISYDKCKTKFHPLYYSMAKRCEGESVVDTEVQTDKNGIVSFSGHKVSVSDELLYTYEDISFHTSVTRLNIADYTDNCGWSITDYTKDLSNSEKLDAYHTAVNHANTCWINVDDTVDPSMIPSGLISCKLIGYDRFETPSEMSLAAGIAKYKKQCDED